jgi:hypothetical protein
MRTPEEVFPEMSRPLLEQHAKRLLLLCEELARHIPATTEAQRTAIEHTKTITDRIRRYR